MSDTRRSSLRLNAGLCAPGGARPIDHVLSGTVRRTVWVLALPVLGEQVLNAAVGFFDTFLAGRISKEATSAVGLAAYVEWLVTMLFALVGMGTTALVARHRGAGDDAKANHFANQSMTLAIGMGLAGFAFIYAIAPTFARLQNMTGEGYAITVHYLRTDALGHVFAALTLVGGAALRGVGDMRTPMKVQAVVNVVNVIASAVLVFGLGPVPPLGWVGIVWGTVIARVVGGVLITVVLLRGRSGLRLGGRALRLRREPVQRLLRIGLPAAWDGVITWSGHFAFLMIIARLAEGELGMAYYAAYVIAIRVEALVYLPADAWASAAATMIGQALGAGDQRRAIRSGHEAARQCVLLSIAVGILYFFAAGPIYALMHREQMVADAGVPLLKALAIFQPFLAAWIIYTGALRGAGDTRYPLLFTTLSVVLVRLPLGYLFGVVLDGGLMGASIGMFADMIFRTILPVIRFSRGKWLKTKV